MGYPGGLEGCTRRLQSISASRGYQLIRYQVKKDKYKDRGEREVRE